MADMVQEVVAGYDGSADSEQTLDWAVWEARARGVALTVCHAWPRGDGTVPGDVAADFEEALGKCAADHPGVTVRRVLAQGAPRSAPLGAASQAHLLVVGPRGRGGLRRMVLGSVSLAVLHYAPCPVIVVRQR